MLSPEEPSRWLRAILTLPSLWLVFTLWHQWTLRALRKRNVGEEPAVTRYFGSALSLVVTGTGIMLITTLSLRIWVRLGDHGADLEIERRLAGMAMSAVLIFIGNTMPKILTPLSMLPPDLATRVTTARRFVGTSAVLLGLVTFVAFLIAPVAIAASLLRWALAAGGLALVGAIVWMNVGPLRRDR